MNEPGCVELGVSWILLFIGIYLFAQNPAQGTWVAFLPLSIAAYLRGTHDRRVTDTLFRGGKWPIFMMVYYFGVLVLAILFARRIFEVSIAIPLGMMMLPFLVAMVIHDISYCRER